MQSVVAYVRGLLGWCEESPVTNRSFKRDRIDDEFSSDDDIPSLKRPKRTETPISRVMELKEKYEEEKRKRNARYELGEVQERPSTSTPNVSAEKVVSRVRTVPIQLVDISPNGPSPSSRTPKNNLRMEPPIRAVIVDDDDEDDQEVTWVQTKKPQKVYINVDDDEEDGNNQQDDDVIFVKRVQKPDPFKYLLNKSELPLSKKYEFLRNYRIPQKTNDNIGNSSPKPFTKLKTPAGITKVYKKSPHPIPKWMQTPATNSLPYKSRFSSLNGNRKSTLREVFNLDEKRNYQELIKKFSDTTKPVTFKKSTDIINLAEDSAALRLTQRSQKISLNEIKLLESARRESKDTEGKNEYDPITVASLNSSDSEVEVVSTDNSTSSFKIDPINTLRDNLKISPVTSHDWLAKLDSKYKKKRQETQDKLKEIRRESDIISKVNYEQNLAHLEQKLKYELSIPESLIVEPVPTAELPPLTPEQEQLVKKAIGPGPPGQLLVEKFNLRIHRRDLQTLSGLNWLNDEVINFYMNLLMQRCEENKDLPKVYATNTFFYPKLMQSGQAGLRRWTRKVDIFAHDLMIVPVHLGVHWCLSIIDFRKKKIMYLDSMGSSNQPCLNALLQYLRDEHQDKKGSPFDDSGWTTENLKDIPQQMNGSDCGMFACTFAEFSARAAPFSFSQAHMPYLRRKAALEILRARLLL